MTPDSAQKYPPGVASKCCGADARKEHWIQTKYIGNPLIKRDGIKEIKTKIVKLWTCSQCHKPCEVEAKEGEDEL